MNSAERSSVFSIAGIYALRMLGLFLILPVFSLYAEGLAGVTPMLIGMALGAYGFTMAMLQIPFGWLSDRIGRKPVITAGLLIFAFGSVVAALADSIWGVIIGRTLQGAGAIAAAMMALLADLTREEVRTKAMAVVGLTIGSSFALALIVGPLLATWVGVAGIFWLTALLALIGIAVLHLFVADPARVIQHSDVEAVPGQFSRILGDAQLLRLDAGIMLLHAIMTALFVGLPFVLRDSLGVPANQHPWVYLPILLAAVAFMVPLILMAEKRGKMKQVFLFSVGLIGTACLLLAVWHESMVNVVVGLLLFFIAYNALEAVLPSLISRMAPLDGKGTAMGVYSTSQFFGAFLGGMAGGWCYGQYGTEGIFLGAALAALAWLLIALGMRIPAVRATVIAHVGEDVNAAEMERHLLELAGVVEAKVLPAEGAAYLRVDKAKFEQKALDELLQSVRA